MDLAQLAQGAGGAGGLYAILKLAEWVLTRIADRRREGATTDKVAGEAAKVNSEARVAQSADNREWAEQFRSDAAAARADAAAARADAESCRKAMWVAQDAAAQCRREVDTLRDQLAELVEQIQTCARPECPIRPHMPDNPREHTT